MRASFLVAVRGGDVRRRLAIYLGEDIRADEKTPTRDPELQADLDPPLPLVSGDGTWPE
ncbi:MAG: hypothetical protein ABIQ15_07020 [Nocardioides sp.]